MNKGLAVLPSRLRERVPRRGELLRAHHETFVTFCKESHELAPFPRTFREPTGLSGWRTDWRQGAQGLR